jgi:hypothetical protein
MKANVIVPDLNPCGGGERLSLVTMQALSEMGIDFDLTTLKSPDISRLENAYGKNLISVMKNIRKINLIDIIEELEIQLVLHEKQEQQQIYNYDITINTHPDSAPYFRPSFSKNNSIVYCHYPAAKYHIESENIGYLEKDLEIEVIPNVSSYGNNNNDNDKTSIDNSKIDVKTDNKNHKLSETTIKEYFRILKYGYWNLMRNSTVVTNSEFTRKVIVDAFGTDYDSIYILSPPIDVNIFRNVDLTSEQDKNNSKAMIIVGNLYNYFEHYTHLKQMVIDLELTDFVTFEINASLDRLIDLMKKSKVCFSPRPEPFGMAILEAMAAGLIPIVPAISGSAEFVPEQFHYNTLEQAADLVSSAFHLSNAERLQISNSVKKFSSSHYIEGFKRLVTNTRK